MKTVTLAIATAAIGFAGVATPALAGKVQVKSQEVSYAGLNLNTIEGQELLEQRVEIAARRVCDYNRGRTDTRTRRDTKECLAKARSSARQQVAAIIEDQRRGG